MANNEITIDEGTDVVLGMLANDVDFSVIKPDGTFATGDYALGNIVKDQEGTYTILTEEGCSQTINLIVRDLVNCSADSIIPEYRIDGIWQSGQNLIEVDEG